MCDKCHTIVTASKMYYYYLYFVGEDQAACVYNHGFQAGSILQILSKLAAAEMIVATCD